MKDLKQIDKYKAYFKQQLEPKGEKIGLTLNLNKELNLLLKNSIIDNKIDFNVFLGEYDNETARINHTYKRYMVKRVLYSSLYSDYKECLFIEELVNKGSFTFTFQELDKLERFKECMRQNIFNLIKCFLSSELEQTIVYNIKTTE